MDRTLIEKVTSMVLEELKVEQHSASVKPPASMRMVKIYNNLNTKPTFGEVTDTTRSDEEAIEEPTFYSTVASPKNKEKLLENQEKTPARIGIGRAGVRPKTNALLKFRLDHAAAVDAVYGKVTEDLLSRMKWFSVQTSTETQEEYIRRPDLGRKLNEDSKKLIESQCEKNPQVQIVISDGLSSEAIEQNAEDVYLSLSQSLNQLGFQTGTPFFVKNGRVAVMDEIGELLQPDVIILLIGERPGLISAESLSAYICYQPRKGTIEADRMVVSNIHRGGIPPAEAGAYLGNVIKKVLTFKASGVSLLQKEK
ncbi:ethanolamine ammonia-lyase small subunit [Fictibacillus macauensis ZFHKF-1]|uniref:Ethanolamine ammonia-lyase small subunit n=1 Tax=Fictibacillus macauensis ZFHKF-1 TaxID=1196324 RepID=I8UIP2_9BACL|nr:ethanolamine ammonia-lyase subunit EutC [Fictibacillus macauensis]EIT86765.1 ethanolamine ammonia-lyase small subunit [Fictibacillus macauensis ZFHKF-1]